MRYEIISGLGKGLAKTYNVPATAIFPFCAGSVSSGMATSMDESEDDDEMCLYPPGESCKHTLLIGTKSYEHQICFELTFS